MLTNGRLANVTFAVVVTQAVLVVLLLALSLQQSTAANTQVGLQLEQFDATVQRSLDNTELLRELTVTAQFPKATARTILCVTSLPQSERTDVVVDACFAQFFPPEP